MRIFLVNYSIIMYMLELTILAISAAINVLLGLFVFFKNEKSLTGKSFLFLTITFSLWSVANYFSLHPVVFEQIYWVRLVLFFAVFLTYSFLLTFVVFPADVITARTRRALLLAGVIAVIVSLITLSPLVFSTLDYIEGIAKPVAEPGIIVFALTVVTFIALSASSILRKLKQSSGPQKQQLRFVAFGLVASFGLIISTNLFFVIIFDNTDFLPFAPIFSLVFSGSFAYAVIRHGLLDVKIIAARSVAYILTVVSISVFYIVFGGVFLSSVIDADLSPAQQTLIVISAITLAALFIYAKKAFDRLSNRIFYRDRVDIQQTIDDIGKIAASENDLQVIVEKILNTISRDIKASNGRYIILDKKNSKLELFLFQLI